MKNRKKYPWILLDIESSPDEAQVYGPKYEPKIVRYTKYSEITSFSVKWFREKKVYVYDQDDFGGSEIKLLEKLIWWTEQSNYVVAHNGDKFDMKVINARIDFLKLPIIPPGKTVDTLKIARKLWRIPSYALDALGEYFGFGRKKERPRIEGKMTPYQRMMERVYNKYDVVLLERLFEIELPHIGNMRPFRIVKAAWSEDRKCPRSECGSLHVQSRGFGLISDSKVKRYQCQECFHWFWLSEDHSKN